MASQGEAKLKFSIKAVGEKVLKGIQKTFSKITFTAGDVVNGIRSISGALSEFVLKGSELQSVRTSFTNLAASQGQDSQAMLKQMRDLSEGTVNDLELMKQANNALLLGLPVDRFGEMLKIARSSSKATGQSMDFMLSSIVTGLGRGCIADDGVVSVENKKELHAFTMKDAYENKISGAKILALNSSNKSCGYVNFGGFESSGERQCVKLKTENNKSIVLTPDHKVFTTDGWVRADETLGKDIGQRYLTEIEYSKVISIEDAGLRQTYDAVNSDTESYIVNCFIVSNSKLMLDNLGILVDAEGAQKKLAAALGKTTAQLTDNERKQAFINEALRIGNENADIAGQGQITLADRVQQAKVNFENFRAELSLGLQPIFSTIMITLTSLTSIFGSTGDGVKSLTSFFTTLGLEINSIILGIKALIQSAGTGMAALGVAVVQAAKGNFSVAKEIVKEGFDEIKEIQTKANEDQLNARRMVNEEIKKIEHDRVNSKAILQQQEAEKQKEIDAAELQRLNEQANARLEQIRFNNELELLTEDEKHLKKIDRSIKTNQKLLQLEKDKNKRMVLENKIIDLEEEKQKVKKDKAEEARKKAQWDATKKHLGTIASLQNSSNKTLAAAGKAAALTQIAVDGPAAVVSAYKTVPYPFNFVAAAGVAAAVAAQAAKVAGVQLAEGGIVRATPGGVQATIGEGGRSEAVVPLPDDFDPDNPGAAIGGGMNVTFTGPVLGDEGQAREFALMLDNELLKLRQKNESVSFDQDVI